MAKGGGDMKISRYKVLSFDCYGTLVDWETAITKALRVPLRDRDIDLSDLEVLTAFLDIETGIITSAPEKPYQEVLFDVHREFCERYHLRFDDDGARDFASSIGYWPLFPDTQAALNFLSRNHQLVILSNIDNASIARTTAQIEAPFLAVYTAQRIGSYKPDPNNFRYMLARLAELGFAKEQLLHVSVSLYHDHVPARALGIDTCWINRAQTDNGTLAPPPAFHGGVEPTYRCDSLEELVERYE
jgi:2-haloacid dehalogenase